MQNENHGTPMRPARIMVVEDDSLVAIGIVTMLEDLGHTVVEVNSGKAAIAHLERDGAIDLVITDQSMPGMTGVELARSLKVLRPALPVMLATGYRDLPEGDELNLPRLSKPFDEAAVASAVSRLLP